MPQDDYSFLIHDPENTAGSSVPGLDEAPTQVKPLSALSRTSAPSEDQTAIGNILGARLDHFELLDSIGVGGMGRVFRARDTRLDRMVALKVLSPELSNDAEICRRFEQEAKAAARLDDRHFARVYFFGFDKGLRYIAMEYVDGENVRQRIIRQGRLPVAMALNIGLQIARGLVHAAACGVVHRDIKPSNIIVTPDGTAKLVDMGLARNFFQQSSPASELTQAGVTLGTFDYISPEQALDPREADVRSDIYSLGCTLYHALTGRPPFSKGSALQKILQHQNDAVPDPRRYVADLPEVVVSIIMRMLAKEPKDRYQHPAELIEDILSAAALLEIPLPVEQGVASSVHIHPSVWQSQLSWIAPLAILLVGVAVYALLDRPSEPTPSNVAPPPVEVEEAKPVSFVPAPTTRKSTDRQSEILETSPIRQSIAVGADEDLIKAVREAPPDAELRLSGSRYVLRTIDLGDGETIRNARLRLVPADPKSRVEIVVKASCWKSTINRLPILSFVDSSIDMRNLDWLVEPPSNPNSVGILFHWVGGWGKFIHCRFSRQTPGTGGRVTFVELDQAKQGRGGAILASQSIVTGFDQILRSESSSSVRTEWIDCGIANVANVPFDWKGLGDFNCLLEQTTIRGREGTLFRVGRLSTTLIRAKRCVFSSEVKSANGLMPFIAVDRSGDWVSSSAKWWEGSENLYHGRDRLSLSRDGTIQAAGLAELGTWGFHDDGSLLVPSTRPLWASSDADRTLSLSGDDGASTAPWRLRHEYRLADGHFPGIREHPLGQSVYPKDPPVETVQPESAPSIKPMPLRTDLVVDSSLNDSDPDQGIYTDLREAIQASSSQAIIELRGNQPVVAANIAIEAKSITLRSATDSSARLILDTSGQNDPDVQNMFRVRGDSQLTLENLAIEAQTTGERSEAIFDVQSGGTLELQGCVLRLDLHLPNSKLFMARLTRSNEDVDWSVASANVRLSQCIIRSSAGCIHASDDVSWTVHVDGSFVVTSQAFVHLDDKNDEGTTNRSTLLSVDRSTLMLGDTLFTYTRRADATPSARPNLQVAHCVLLGIGTSPLTLYRQPRLSEDASVYWSGSHSFVAGFPIVESAILGSPSMGTPSDEMAPDEWLARYQLADSGIVFGNAQPYSLETSSISSEPLPTTARLQRAGLAESIQGPLGVEIENLPKESSNDSRL